MKKFIETVLSELAVKIAQDLTVSLEKLPYPKRMLVVGLSLTLLSILSVFTEKKFKVNSKK